MMIKIYNDVEFEAKKELFKKFIMEYHHKDSFVDYTEKANTKFICLVSYISAFREEYFSGSQIAQLRDIANEEFEKFPIRK